jgi:hypothetical protein
MTIERQVFVELNSSDPAVSSLIQDIRSLAARAGKAMPGERIDIVRYESVSTQLELCAAREFARGARYVEMGAPVSDREAYCLIEPGELEQLSDFGADVLDWARSAADSSAVLVELRFPLTAGVAAAHAVGRPGPRAVASTWAADEGVVGRQAVTARFRAQLESVLSGDAGSAVSPSGVSNSILTEVLREFVSRMDGPRVDAPVVYRDGSAAEPFPLRSLPLADKAPLFDRTMRFALLSIRHAEMDVAVDGAWLRNTEVSRVRPAGETDRVVYEISRRQLRQLAASESTLIYLYQTGFETAVMGFYRALVQQLLDQPNSIAVVPMFFRRITRGDARRTIAGYEQQSHFSEGKPWTL